MDNIEFDKIIKEQLGKMDGLSPSQASWDMMKSHLEDSSESISDTHAEELDHIVQSTLNKYEVPFNQSHQDQFINQYFSMKASRRQDLYNYMSRAAIIVLLLFSCIHLYNNVGYNQENRMLLVDDIERSNNMEQDPQEEFTSSSIKVKDINYSLPLESKNNINQFTSVNISSKEDFYLSPSIEGIECLEEDVVRTMVYESPFQIVSNSQTLVSYTDKEIPLTSMNYVKMKQMKQSKNITLGAWVSFDKDRNYNYEGDQYNNGVSSGLSVSTKVGNFEFETGLEYSNISFDPSDNNNVYGRNINLQTLKIENVDLVVSSLPIIAKYHLPINENTSAYTLLGSKYNTILFNKSQKQTKDYNNVRTPIDIVYREQPSLAGALEGGSIKDNSFISASFGFGIEKRYNDNTIAFIEPSYEAQIHPHNIKYTNDRLRGFNLKLGVKKRI